MTTYGAITPARDEETFLPGLINSMLSQTRLPLRWIIIDDGSVDSTPRLADDLASRHKWVTVHHVPCGAERQPGGETALQRFLSPESWNDCDVIFRVDADISFEPDFVQSMLAEFRRDPRLGIASGALYERRRGEWQEVEAAAVSHQGCDQDVLARLPQCDWRY